MMKLSTSARSAAVSGRTFWYAGAETLSANERQAAALNLGALPALILDGTPLVGADAILRAAGASP